MEYGIGTAAGKRERTNIQTNKTDAQNIVSKSTICMLKYLKMGLNSQNLMNLMMLCYGRIGGPCNDVYEDIILCSPLKVNHRFEGKYCLHFHGRKMSQAINRNEIFD
jgi:hypothetical protein